jgi:hypothetical protein
MLKFYSYFVSLSGVPLGSIIAGFGEMSYDDIGLAVSQ